MQEKPHELVSLPLSQVEDTQQEQQAYWLAVRTTSFAWSYIE
jgi:hypothetical protein